MFDALFTDPDVDQIFTDDAIIGAMLRFEGALVQAQADLNLIPSQPADLIAHVCLNAQIDADKIVASARDAGNPAIPLVKELSELVSSADPEAAKFVHTGATSQDVIDSAVMLQLKPALIKIESGIEQLQQRLGKLVGDGERLGPQRDTGLAGLKLGRGLGHVQGAGPDPPARVGAAVVEADLGAAWRDRTRPTRLASWRVRRNGSR